MEIYMTYQEARELYLKSFKEHDDLYRKKLEDIEKYRKGEKKVRILDQKGAPVSNKRVKITQKTHEFKYGANIFLLDEFPTEEENRIYRDTFYRYFNLATLPFYWAELEPEEGKLRFDKDSPKIYRRPAPDLCLEYCNEKGITPKLHCLFYDFFTPEWLPKDNKEEMYRLYDKRFREIAERYRGKMWEFEVTNEILDIGRAGESVLVDEPDIIEWCFKKAREYFGNDAKLVINEGNYMPMIGRKGYSSPIILEYRRLLERGVGIDKLGMQHHAFTGVNGDQISMVDHDKDMFNAEYIDKGLRILTSLGKPVEITEMTVPCLGDGPEGEECQAELIKYLYTYFFACPMMENVVYWNTVDNMCHVSKTLSAWNENNCHGGLFHRDLTPKPAALMLKKLFGEVWHTDEEVLTDADGYASFRGFFGDYEASFDGGFMKFTHSKRDSK